MKIRLLSWLHTALRLITGYTMGRFDYVKYDGHAEQVQKEFKFDIESLELSVNEKLVSPRAKALVLTKLEEVYMWIGKAIRDDQIKRSGSAPLQEERTNS